MAARFAGVLRASDTVGRPGGDEFAILADGLSLSAGPELLAERLLDALNEPFWLEGVADAPLSVRASIGIATNEADEPDDLLRDAAIALCQAKAQGRNCHVRFRPEMKTAAMERLRSRGRSPGSPAGEPVLHPLSTDIRARQRRGVRRGGPPALAASCSGHRRTSESFMPVLEETGMIAPVGSGC